MCNKSVKVMKSVDCQSFLLIQHNFILNANAFLFILTSILSIFSYFASADPTYLRSYPMDTISFKTSFRSFRSIQF